MIRRIVKEIVLAPVKVAEGIVDAANEATGGRKK